MGISEIFRVSVKRPRIYLCRQLTGSLLLPKMKFSRAKIARWENEAFRNHRRIKMGKTVRARYSKGVIKPLEKVDIEEGKEITITIMEVFSKHKLDAFKKSAGAWKGTIDAKKLIENIYADRLLSTREEPRKVR